MKPRFLPISQRLRMLGDAVAPPGAALPPPARVPTSWAPVDAVLGGGIPASGLHEWWGDLHDARAACVHLAWQAIRFDDVHRPEARRHVAWVGRAAWPVTEELVRGLRSPVRGLFGVPAARTWPDASLHGRSLLVDVASHDSGARLWAIEQAVRCPGVCAVVADGRGFDLAATRRLQLAAGNVLLLALRGPARDGSVRRAAPSACTTRWHVVPSCRRAGALPPWLRASHPLASRIPAEPAWTVTLERAKGQGVRLSAECTVQAVRSHEWDGIERMPSATAARRLRRARRIEVVHGAHGRAIGLAG